VYSLLKSSGVKHVIWYCGEFYLTPRIWIETWEDGYLIFSGEGSCNGRGPRTAAWFADYLEQRQDGSMQSLILEGGIKGWVKAGEEYTELMEEFDASKW
jgi:arsenical-resistance protein 2